MDLHHKLTTLVTFLALALPVFSADTALTNPKITGPIKMNGSTSGTLTLTAPAIAGSKSLALPSLSTSTGTVMAFDSNNLADWSLVTLNLGGLYVQGDSTFESGSVTVTGPLIFETGFNFGNIIPAANLSRDSLFVDRPVYLSPTGNDNNVGTRAAPLLTTAAALTRINNAGEIILLAGDYTNLKFNLASAKKVTIRSEPNALVRIYMGETISSGFTTDTSNVYYATITTVIPAASDSTVWVFEDSTPEGSITAPHPLQRGRANRLDHTRLPVAASLAALRSGGNGAYFYDSGTSRLYIKATDASNLASSPKTYRVPSQTANQSFVYGGAATTDIEVREIQVFYGYDNFDFSNVSRFRMERCLAFGAGREGMYADAFGTGEDENCEFAANANDGIGTQNLTTDRISILTSHQPWHHDNGDEGLSTGHGVSGEAYHCMGISYGGLFENQSRGSGLTTFNSRHTAHNPRTRSNYIGIASGGVDQMDVYGLVSTSDTYGCYVGSAGSVVNLWYPTLRDSTIAAQSTSNGAALNSYYPRTNTPALMRGGDGANVIGESYLATSGAFEATITLTGATNVTLPTTGTLATRAGSESLTGKTVNGLTISTTTGTLTLANNSTLATSGASPITLTSAGTTNITLPTTGTLAISSGAQTLNGNQTVSGGYVLAGNGFYVSNGPYGFVGSGAEMRVIDSTGLQFTTAGGSAPCNVTYKLRGTAEAAPTIASASTIAPVKSITFVSGTTSINTITVPAPISAGGGTITLIPTGVFSTGTSGNIALASIAVVSRALEMTYDVTTAKWYPSY